MPKLSLKVGLVQLTSGEDVDANVQAIWRGLEKLKSEKCDLICLPENALYLRVEKKTGALVAFHLREKLWDEFRIYSKQNDCALLFGSVPVLQRPSRAIEVSSATVLVSSGRRPQVVYEKIHLFDVDVKGAPPVRESDEFKAGRKPGMIKVKGWNIGLSICYDVRFSELYLHYARRNVHLILVPAAFLVPTGQAHWHTLLRARAIESQAFVVAAAQSGGHRGRSGTERSTYGHSLVVDPWGEVLVDLDEGGAKVAAVELIPERLLRVRAQIPMFRHRRL